MMNTEIKSWAEWAASQGWTVEDNEKGYTHFWTPDGTWAAYYPATPSNPRRRLLDLKVALRKHGL
ncbi:MAG: hypothetical protein L0K86_08955, partial [Actinomycetia bacterium]|nr:hypothetical protein [Actinomycetes bacterium]